MARPIASMARPFEVERLSRKPSPASRSASTAWSICSAGSGGSQVPKARMRCGELDSASCDISSEVSPLICGRLSPAAQEIRICGSANSSARSRSAWTCRSAMSERSRASHSGGPDARAHQQDRRHHGKAEQRQRRRQHREFLVIEVEQGRNRLRDGQVSGRARVPAKRPGRWRARSRRCAPVRCTTAGFDASPRLRPTLFAPKTHDCRPGATPRMIRQSVSGLAMRSCATIGMSAPGPNFC